MKKVLGTIWMLFLVITLSSLTNKTSLPSDNFEAQRVFNSFYQSDFQNPSEDILQQAEPGSIGLYTGSILTPEYSSYRYVNPYLQKYLKKAYLCFENRHSLLSLRHTTFVPLGAILSCDYYVFALRQLLI